MSQRNIRLLDDALADLRAGEQFYETLQQGVGAWFRDSLLADMESLHLYAGIHARHFNYYRMLARRFPYAVYYDLEADVITVVAVLPLRRDPHWIAEQFADRTS